MHCTARPRALIRVNVMPSAIRPLSGSLHQINGGQRVRGGHVWPCSLDSPNGKLDPTQVIPTGCLGIPKSLPDDILKVRVHADMRAQLVAKEKAPPERGQLKGG